MTTALKDELARALKRIGLPQEKPGWYDLKKDSLLLFESPRNPPSWVMRVEEIVGDMITGPIVMDLRPVLPTFRTDSLRAEISRRDYEGSGLYLVTFLGIDGAHEKSPEHPECDVLVRDYRTNEMVPAVMHLDKPSSAGAISASPNGEGAAANCYPPGYWMWRNPLEQAPENQPANPTLNRVADAVGATGKENPQDLADFIVILIDKLRKLGKSS